MGLAAPGGKWKYSTSCPQILKDFKMETGEYTTEMETFLIMGPRLLNCPHSLLPLLLFLGCRCGQGWELCFHPQHPVNRLADCPKPRTLRRLLTPLSLYAGCLTLHMARNVVKGLLMWEERKKKGVVTNQDSMLLRSCLPRDIVDEITSLTDKRYFTVWSLRLTCLQVGVSKTGASDYIFCGVASHSLKVRK